VCDTHTRTHVMYTAVMSCQSLTCTPPPSIFSISSSATVSPACSSLPVLVLSPCCGPRKHTRKQQQAAAGLKRQKTESECCPQQSQQAVAASSGTIASVSSASAASVLCTHNPCINSALLRRAGWDPYRHWCLTLLLLLPASSLRRDLMPCDENVLSDKAAFITAVRTAALSKHLPLTLSPSLQGPH
jgi:hypothetical protein